MKNLECVILAAGRGTRLKTDIPKALHKIAGRPLIEHLMLSLEKAGIKSPIVVTGYGRKALREFLKGRATGVWQKKQLGTADAVLAAKNKISSGKRNVLILSADVPLVSADSLKKIIARHTREKLAATIMTAKRENPKGGRIIRDGEGHIEAIVEESDASLEIKSIKEINAGVYVFCKEKLFRTLEKIKPENKQNEYYLTDAVKILVSEGEKVGAQLTGGELESFGVNSRKDLAEMNKEVFLKNADFHMEKGVSVVSPETTFIENDVKIGKDTVIQPSTYIESGVKIGKKCQIGPFAKIREGSNIKDGAVIGSFVEIVRAEVGEASVIKHLSYIGDAKIGKQVNIGAGTITANYDGRKKNRTVIKDKSFIGCDTVLIAPVTVGRAAKTGAGSVIPGGKNVRDGETVAGVPAKLIRKKGVKNGG